MSWVLYAAGIYHIAFAIWANAWPHAWFDWCGLERLNHPMLWRGIGVLEGALGIGFLAVASNPLRHWPVVGVGLAKCSLGLAGFLTAFTEGGLPACALLLACGNHFVWWLPFTVILLAALRAQLEVPQGEDPPPSVAEAAVAFHLSSGESLAQASCEQPLAIVFLRHFGCTFTRQILRGLETLRREADQRGARLVLVHMLRNGEETRYVRDDKVARIADPHCQLYRAFGLGKGDLLGLIGPMVLLRGAISLFKGCGVGHLAGDGFQMPGVFVFHQGKILAAERPRSASHLPNLTRLFEGLPSASAPATVAP
jgi:hypothetical protein